MNKETVEFISKDCPCEGKGNCLWRDYYTRKIADEDRTVIQISLLGLYGKRIGVSLNEGDDPRNFYRVVVPRWNEDGLAKVFAEVWEETHNYKTIKSRLGLD